MKGKWKEDTEVQTAENQKTNTYRKSMLNTRTTLLYSVKVAYCTFFPDKHLVNKITQKGVLETHTHRIKIWHWQKEAEVIIELEESFWMTISYCVRTFSYTSPCTQSSIQINWWTSCRKPSFLYKQVYSPHNSKYCVYKHIKASMAGRV